MSQTIHKDKVRVGRVRRRDGTGYGAGHAGAGRKEVGISAIIPTGQFKKIWREGEEKKIAINSTQILWVSEEDAWKLFESLCDIFNSKGELL